MNTNIPSSTQHTPFSITNPEKSPELNTLTEGIRMKIPDIFRENISPQMENLLSRLPAFEDLVSRKHRIFNNMIYHFITSRGYITTAPNDDMKKGYDEIVENFIRRGEALGAKIDTDVFVETEIIAGAPRGNRTYKYYQTFDEKKWKYVIEKLPELYGMIAREFANVPGERISAKFPRYLSIYTEKCDNLVLYCRDISNLPKVQEIMEQWIYKYSIPVINRPFYRSVFGIDGKADSNADKTSFSDLCANLAIKYANDCDIWQKRNTGKPLTDKEYNTIALGQACMMSSGEPIGLNVKTKR